MRRNEIVHARQDWFDLRYKPGALDAGEDPKALGFDLENAVIDEPDLKRINIDLPAAVLARLDHEAQIRGIMRQSLIKVWLYDRLGTISKAG
jgi:hypothetical protein